MKCTMMNTSIGTFQIGAVSLILLQDLALDMTNMEERFQNWGRIMI